MRDPGDAVLSSGQDISADAEAVLECEGAERVCEYRSGVGEILGAWAGVAGGARPPAVVCHWRERGKARHDGFAYPAAIDDCRRRGGVSGCTATVRGCSC